MVVTRRTQPQHPSTPHRPDPTPSEDPVSPLTTLSGLKVTQPTGNVLAGKDTFQRLAKDVSTGALSKRDAKVLSGGAGSLGVIGEAQAIRAAHLSEALSAPDRAAFEALLDAAHSDTARGFLFKALAAGYSIPEVTTFAQAVRGFSDAQLIDRLSLADDQIGVNAALPQDGVKQQFDTSCVATTAQSLRAEFDPIYALSVRTSNTDVSQVDDHDPFRLNASLATEQKHILEDLGTGHATPRDDSSGTGVPRSQLPAVYGGATRYTGFTYAPNFSSAVTDTTIAHGLCDGLAAQLSKGIPTPLSITGDSNQGGHAILAVAIDGTGSSQRFLLHDPWNGVTLWVPRTQLEQGTFNVAGWNRLRGYLVATPAPGAVQ